MALITKALLRKDTFFFFFFFFFKLQITPFLVFDYLRKGNAILKKKGGKKKKKGEKKKKKKKLTPKTEHLMRRKEKKNNEIMNITWKVLKKPSKRISPSSG